MQWCKEAEDEIRDNYQFILPARASRFRSVSKTISIPEDLGRRCDCRTCRNRRGILDASIKFGEKFSIALGFLPGVLAFPDLLFCD
jgi:hypothetical protein